MVIDAVLEPGKSGRVGAGLAFEHNGTSVREYETVPNEQHARLAEGDLGVIDADEFCALRDKQEAPRRAVVNVFGHLRGDLAGKVGTDAGGIDRRRLARERRGGRRCGGRGRGQSRRRMFDHIGRREEL